MNQEWQSTFSTSAKSYKLFVAWQRDIWDIVKATRTGQGGPLTYQASVTGTRHQTLVEMLYIRRFVDWL